MRMTRILRIMLKYKFVKPLTRWSEQQESTARPVCGARRALKLFSTLSEHFFGNESTQNRTKVHKMASNAVQSFPPPCRVVTCDDRIHKRFYSIVVQKITCLPPRPPQVAPLQLCTIPVYKFCFSPHFPPFPVFPRFPPFPHIPPFQKVSSHPETSEFSETSETSEFSDNRQPTTDN